MGTGGFIVPRTVKDKLTSRSVGKSILRALGDRDDAIASDRFGEFTGLNSTYNVNGVEEKPHELRFNPNPRRP